MSKYYLSRGTITRTTTTRGSSTSSTTATTQVSSTSSTSGRKPSENDIASSIVFLKETYQECLKAPMPVPVERRITDALIRGVPFEYFSYALTEASYAPRPSWRYAEAIVSRCIRERVLPEMIFWQFEDFVPAGYKAPSIRD